MVAAIVTEVEKRLYGVDTELFVTGHGKPECHSISKRYFRPLRAVLRELACFVVIGLALPAGVIEADGYTITQLTDDPSYEGQPAWSPDGSKIAFVSDRGGNKALYVMDANGSNQRKLIDSEMWDNEFWEDTEPDWSPDASKIVFSSNINGSSDIWTVDVNTDDPLITLTPLTHSSSDERGPAWRYNKDKILYYDHYWDGTVWVIDANGSSQAALATGRYPSWSPDATEIVFSSCECEPGGFSAGICVMKHDGSEHQSLHDRGYEPAWSPHGTRIVFGIEKLDITPDSRTYFPDLYIMDSDGGNLERLTFDEWEYDCVSWGLLRRSPTWSPDGNKIAYHYKGDIWVMSGFSKLAADIQHDGIVNLRDFGVIAEYWLENEPLADIAPDGGDGVVHSLDLARLCEEWLHTEEWYHP